MMYITTCITILVSNQLVAKNFLLYIFFSIKGPLDLSEGVKFEFGCFLEYISNMNTSIWAILFTLLLKTTHKSLFVDLEHVLYTE
jgi:hypothetical protein